MILATARRAPQARQHTTHRCPSMQIADRRALWRKYRAIWHEPVECPSEMSRNEFNQQVDDILIEAFGPEPEQDEIDD